MSKVSVKNVFIDLIYAAIDDIQTELDIVVYDPAEFQHYDNKIASNKNRIAKLTNVVSISVDIGHILEYFIKSIRQQLVKYCKDRKKNNIDFTEYEHDDDTEEFKNEIRFMMSCINYGNEAEIDFGDKLEAHDDQDTVSSLLKAAKSIDVDTAEAAAAGFNIYLKRLAQICGYTLCLGKQTLNYKNLSPSIMTLFNFTLDDFRDMNAEIGIAITPYEKKTVKRAGTKKKAPKAKEEHVPRDAEVADDVGDDDEAAEIEDV